MKAVIYILLFISGLSIATIYFVNGKAINAPAPVAVLPESPWVIKGAKNKSESEIFAPCASCHMADGSGRSDGEVPRLAGQSEKVLINKLQKLRNGSSYLPVMVPFARALTEEELLIVSRYMAELPNLSAPIQPDFSKLNEIPLKYEQYCSACHGSVGQGNDALLSPKLCGQHASYLIRRIKEIKENIRGDADLSMISILDTITQDEQIDIANWLESVQCKAGYENIGQVNLGNNK